MNNWQLETDTQSDIANALYEIAYYDSEYQYDFIHVVPADLIKVIETYYDDEKEWIWTAVREGDWNCTIYITAHDNIKISAFCDMWKGLITIIRNDG